MVEGPHAPCPLGMSTALAPGPHRERQGEAGHLAALPHAPGGDRLAVGTMPHPGVHAAPPQGVLLGGRQGPLRPHAGEGVSHGLQGGPEGLGPGGHDRARGTPGLVRLLGVLAVPQGGLPAPFSRGRDPPLGRGAPVHLPLGERRGSL